MAAAAGGPGIDRGVVLRPSRKFKRQRKRERLEKRRAQEQGTIGTYFTWLRLRTQYRCASINSYIPLPLTRATRHHGELQGLLQSCNAAPQAVGRRSSRPAAGAGAALAARPLVLEKGGMEPAGSWRREAANSARGATGRGSDFTGRGSDPRRRREAMWGNGMGESRREGGVALLQLGKRHKHGGGDGITQRAWFRVSCIVGGANC